jgi:hypothetical protein
VQVHELVDGLEGRRPDRRFVNTLEMGRRMGHLASKAGSCGRIPNRLSLPFPPYPLRLIIGEDRLFNSQWIISNPVSIANRYRKLVPILLDAQANFRFAVLTQSVAQTPRFCLRRMNIRLFGGRE